MSCHAAAIKLVAGFAVCFQLVALQKHTGEELFLDLLLFSSVEAASDSSAGKELLLQRNPAISQLFLQTLQKNGSSLPVHQQLSNVLLMLSAGA